mgnify:CR=1 FL=1
MPNPCGRRSINWRRDCPSWASATTISNPATSTSPSDGRLIPVRYHFARFGEGHDAEGFERLRQFVREQGGKGQMLCDAEPSRYTTLPEFPGHLFVGEMSDQLVRVEDETGYGFVDTENRPVIAPQFVWAADFREGRAEVQTAQGMGLIDKRGHYVIEPRYEIVDYNPYTGCSRIRSEGLWALADYNGRIVGGFTPRYIEENDTSKLNNLTKNTLWKT